MPDQACFLFVKKGSITSYAENENLQINSNEGILMKCGTYLAKMLNEGPEGTYEAVAVHFYPEVLEEIFDSGLPDFLKPPKDGQSTPPFAKLDEDDLFARFFDALIYYFGNPHLVNEELITLKLKEILLLLNNTTASAKLHQILSNLFAPQVYNFKSIVESHLFDNLSLDELAFMCGLSLSSFKRNFTAIYHDSPAKYIKDQRLKRAANLLRKSNLTISEIAYKCAYADLGHFSKSFKSKYQLSPKDYRESV